MVDAFRLAYSQQVGTMPDDKWHHRYYHHRFAINDQMIRNIRNYKKPFNLVPGELPFHFLPMHFYYSCKQYQIVMPIIPDLQLIGIFAFLHAFLCYFCKQVQDYPVRESGFGQVIMID